MRKSISFVAALLAAVPASALTVRTYVPQTVGMAYRLPSIVQNRAQGFRGPQPASFSLSAPQITQNPLALGQPLIQQAPEVRVQAYREAPMAALSRSVDEWNSLLNTGAPSERLLNSAQALFDGRRLNAGSGGSFGASLGSRYQKDVQEAVAAAVEVIRLTAGNRATDAFIARVREHASAQMLAVADVVQAVENGAKPGRAVLDPLLETFATMSEELFMELYGASLDQSIAAGNVPAASRAEILEKIKTPIATLVRVHKAWERVLIAAKDKSPKFGANLLSKLEEMRGGALVSVTVTYEIHENHGKILQIIAQKHGLQLELMEKIGAAVLRGVGIDALRVLAAQPLVEHVDLEQNYSIH